MKQSWKKRLRLGATAALKIGCGSALAIFIATMLGLKNPTAAGTITLLTVLASTRKGTLALIGQRLASFFLTVFLSYFLFSMDNDAYVSFGILLIVDTFLLEMLQWQSTLSVNALIGMHFLTSQDFSFSYIANEFLLLLLGMAIAMVLNLMQPMVSDRQRLYRRIHQVEEDMEQALSNVSDYLKSQKRHTGTWKNISVLEEQITQYVQDASVFAQNSFRDEDEWFVAYFEARQHQCLAIHRLHAHCIAIREIPKDAKIVSDYIGSMVGHVKDTTVPQAHLERADELITQVCKEGSGTGQDSFESQAMLFHILLDMKEYVQIKQNFILSLNDKEKEQYEKKDSPGEMNLLQRAFADLFGGE